MLELFRPTCEDDVIRLTLAYSHLLNYAPLLLGVCQRGGGVESEALHLKRHLLVQLGQGTPADVTRLLLGEPDFIRESIAGSPDSFLQEVGGSLRRSCAEFSSHDRSPLLRLLQVVELPRFLLTAGKLPGWIDPLHRTACSRASLTPSEVMFLTAHEVLPGIQCELEGVTSWHLLADWEQIGFKVNGQFRHDGFLVATADAVAGGGGLFGVALDRSPDPRSGAVTGPVDGPSFSLPPFDVVLFAPLLEALACDLKTAADCQSLGNVMEQLLALAGVELGEPLESSVENLEPHLLRNLLVHEVRHCQVFSGDAENQASDPEEEGEWEAEYAVVESLKGQRLTPEWAVAVAGFLFFSGWPCPHSSLRMRSAKDVVFLRALVDEDPMGFLEKRRCLTCRRFQERGRAGFRCWRNRSMGQLYRESLKRLRDLL